MNSELIRLWLTRKKKSGAIARMLTSLVAFLAGLFVLFITFWLGYAVIWICVPGVSAITEMGFGRKVHLAFEWRLVLCGAFLVLLFQQHLRTNPWHWGDYGEVDPLRVRMVTHSLGPFAALLTAPGASANLIADILLSGPRLVTGSWGLWRESRRLAAVDLENCSRLLSFLASRPAAVPYEELHEAGWDEWLPQLRNIEGVVFLEKGISLNGELRTELSKLTAN